MYTLDELRVIAEQGETALDACLLPIEDGLSGYARVVLDEVSPAPQREAYARVTLDPPDAADGALWFNATAWQGQEGRSVVTELKRVSPGVYRTAAPIPLYGDWKTTLRLHEGRRIAGLPVFLPEDPAIPVGEVPAEPNMTREFVLDKDNRVIYTEQVPEIAQEPDYEKALKAAGG